MGFLEPTKTNLKSKQKIPLTISYLANELLSFAYYLCEDEKQTFEVSQKSFQHFSFKNKTRFLGEFRIKKIRPKEFVFKKNDLLFLFEQIIFFYKRDLDFHKKSVNQNLFDKLNWQQKIVILLMYKFNFSGHEISNLLELSRSQLIELVYSAKVILGLDFDEDVYDNQDLTFSDSDNLYFYKKNLEIFTSFNTFEKDSRKSNILEKIPHCSIDSTLNFRLGYFMTETLAEFALEATPGRSSDGKWG